MQEVKFDDLQEVSDEKREHIENYKKSGGFEEYLENQTLLTDSSKSILKILTDNLVDKVKKVSKELRDKQLYKYIMSNVENGAFIQTDKFTNVMLKKLIDSKGEIIGCFVIEENNSLTLYTSYQCALGYFWELYEIPTINVIREYCHKVLENGLEREDAVALGRKEYDTALSIDQSKYDRNHKVINGERIYFEKSIVMISSEEGEEE